MSKTSRLPPSQGSSLQRTDSILKSFLQAPGRSQSAAVQAQSSEFQAFAANLAVNLVFLSWPPYSQSGQTPQNPQNRRKIEILLHKWTAGPICPDRYGPYLSFSSGTSQEMSLSKPLESTQSWRGEAAPTLG